MSHPDNTSNDWIETSLESRRKWQSSARNAAFCLRLRYADDVVKLVESVEEFEALVESRGGDLMVDEPPTSARATGRSGLFAADASGRRVGFQLPQAAEHSTAAVQEHRPAS